MAKYASARKVQVVAFDLIGIPISKRETLAGALLQRAADSDAEAWIPQEGGWVPIEDLLVVCRTFDVEKASAIFVFLGRIRGSLDEPIEGSIRCDVTGH